MDWNSIIRVTVDRTGKQLQIPLLLLQVSKSIDRLTETTERMTGPCVTIPNERGVKAQT
ncbi:hypothetical protein PILCRDRAFT_823556 [Piloderma croceum F 1598]|uniref:Uncharacterized protein n=1 Tax=Piloderma croceum (strain F 1598) TaxID=765440 RepID=A0A0C3FI55_PILCF|nr:hypothetical protein PILCRDRAFT_823556 [Piloderma croceum F 1598]